MSAILGCPLYGSFSKVCIKGKQVGGGGVVTLVIVVMALLLLVEVVCECLYCVFVCVS